MKYVPKHIGEEENVNISNHSQLKELALVCSGVLGIVLTAYIALGFIVNFLLANYENQVLSALGSILKNTIADAPKLNIERTQVQLIVDKLAAKSAEPKAEYSVHISPEKQINAVAYPGRQIVVYSGLLNQIESENELAMILAHELGHFAKKHHIRGLGRGLVFLMISSVVFGQESAVTAYIGNLFGVLNAHYSREQESEADHFGLNLLVKAYGHAGGANDFFIKMRKKEDSIAFQLFANSHPLSDDRIKHIKLWIKENNFKTLPVKPLSFSIASQDE